MNFWKIISLSALCLGLLWLLSPSHSNLASEPGVEEISYMAPGGPIASPMDDAVRAFERQSREAHAKDASKPMYRVISGQNASRDPSEDPTRFLLSAAGGTPPDVIAFDRYAVSEWAARGAFTPLDSFMAKDEAQKRGGLIRSSDFFKSAWDEAIYTDPISGKKGLYGVPFSIDSRAMFYNKDLLKRAGFVDKNGEAKPPQTWEELEEVAVKTTETDEAGHTTRIGFVPNFGNSWLYIFGWMNGGEFMSADGKRCTLNDPKIVGALEWMTRVYDKLGGAKAVYAFQSTFQGGDLDPFILGKVGIKIDGVWVLDTMAQFGTHLNWAATNPPMPAAEVAKGRKTLSWVGGWCYSIPVSAKHKEAAWELIRFLSTQRANEIMAESARLTARSQGRTFVPVQHPNIKINDWLSKHYVYDDPATDPKISHALHVFNDLLNFSRYRPVTMVGQQLWVEHINAMENAIFHKMSPKEALDKGTNLVQSQLDIALKPPTGAVPDWDVFLWVYAAVVVLLALLVFVWDTQFGLRKSLAKLLKPVGLDKLLPAGGDLEGVHSKIFRSQWKDGWILASPWLIGFIFLTGGPIAFSIVISFCRYDVFNPGHFLGLENYKWMLGEPIVWKSLGNTVYMMMGIPLGMAVSLGIAMLLNLNIKGIAVWRTFFFVPSIIPAVAASILWIWVLNPSSGLLNSMLGSIGINGPNWLQDENTSKASLILMGLWGAGGGMIIWLAGLKGISESYYEAASLDGADMFQKFYYVTIPMLSPYIFFNLIMGIIGTLKIFDQAFIMTKGGPVESTTFFVYELFNRAFKYMEMGRAAAEAWMLFLLIFALTMLNLYWSKKWVHYEGD